MATESVCPPLGTGSVDLNALHQAAMKKQDLEVALVEATTRVEPEPVSEPEQPAPEPAAKDTAAKP